MDLFNKKKVAELTTQLINAQRTLHERDLLAGALGQSHGGKRDIYEIFGYPKDVAFSDLYQYARRAGIANRVVFGLARSCWRDGFYLSDGEENELLEDEINKLSKKLLQAAERADALNRIGKFSCLFVGVPDGLEPREPVGRVMGNALESVYFRPFAYDGIEIYAYDQDPTSPRFMLPELYQLRVAGRGDNGKDIDNSTIIAHWSRVVHLCETKFDSEIEGVPALEPIFNNILAIDKACGGSAEAYFRNARGKFSFEVDPEFGTELIDNAEAKQSFDDASKKFTNDWQDHVVTLGSKVTSHSTAHSSPLDTVKVNLWGVTAQTGLPIRILTGEGGGQLAGSEDKLAYNIIVDDRQKSFCNGIVERVLDILDESGAIDKPDTFEIEWLKQEATTEAEQTDIGLKRAQTLQAITSAASTIAGDGIDVRTALNECYLQNVEYDEVQDFGDSNENRDDIAFME